VSATSSKRRRVNDWTSVNGANAEIVQFGQTLASETIDGVTIDGAIVWLQDDTGGRRLYERCEFFEVWVLGEDPGLNYKVSKAELFSR
jgi:hypothetical protein